jgi:hypothetical protein
MYGWVCTSMNCDFFFILIITWWGAFQMQFALWTYSFLLSFKEIAPVPPCTVHVMTPFSISVSLAEKCLFCDERYRKHLFSCYVDSKRPWEMKNNCVHTTCIQGLHFSCYLMFCSLWHLPQYSHALSIGKLSCIIYIQIFFYFLVIYYQKLYTIHTQVVCRVVRHMSARFSLLCMFHQIRKFVNDVSERMWKEAVVAYFKILSRNTFEKLNWWRTLFDMIWGAQCDSVQDWKQWTEFLYHCFCCFCHATVYLLLRHVYILYQRHSRYIVLQNQN